MTGQPTTPAHSHTTRQWALRLTFRCETPVTEDAVEKLSRILAPVHACVALEEDGRVAVQTSAEADILEAAVYRVMALVSGAFHLTGLTARLQNLDALSETEFDLQQEQAEAARRIPDVYGRQDIASVLGITSAEAAALVRSLDWKTITTPVPTLRGGNLYTLSQVQEYQDSRRDS